MDKNKLIGSILAGVASVGVVGVAYLSSRAALKAEKTDSKTEKISAYVPTAAATCVTVAAIVTGSIFSSKATATAAAATAACATAAKKYKPKIEELIKKYSEQRKSSDETTNEFPDPDEVVTFFDYENMKYFEGRLGDVIEKVVMDDGMEVYIVTSPFEVDIFKEVIV